MSNIMKTIFWKIFNLVAGCASIVGVLFLFFSDKQVGVAALFAFCLFLFGLLVSIWIGIKQLIKNEHPDE